MFTRKFSRRNIFPCKNASLSERRSARSSSTELPKFRDRLVKPLNAQSYRTFLPYAGRIPGLKGRRNKFNGDTRLSRSRSRWRSRPTDAHRRPRRSGFNAVGRSRVQLRPKPVYGRDCRSIGGWQTRSLAYTPACFSGTITRAECPIVSRYF